MKHEFEILAPRGSTFTQQMAESEVGQKVDLDGWGRPQVGTVTDAELINGGRSMKLTIEED